MIGAELETLRPSTGEGFSDAVTVSFGDPEAQLFGIARIGLTPGAPAVASALAIVFAANGPMAAESDAAVPVEDPDWAQIAVGAVRMRTLEPLQAWQVAFDGGGASFDLSLRALAAPVEFGEQSSAARAGGITSYEQPCRVEGTASVDGVEHELRCLGQRGHGWGAVNWSSIEAARTLSVWLGEDRAIALAAIRPAGANGHDAEAISAYLLEDHGEGLVAFEVAEPRLSTTYDAEGHQRRAGLELWMASEEDEELELPRRVAGEVVCGSSLELGRLRLDCAFFAWRMEGRDGVGRYDVLRRA